MVDFFLRSGSEVFESGCIIHRRLRKTHACQIYEAVNVKGQCHKTLHCLGSSITVQLTFRGLSTAVRPILNNKTTVIYLISSLCESLLSLCLKQNIASACSFFTQFSICNSKDTMKKHDPLLLLSKHHQV